MYRLSCDYFLNPLLYETKSWGLAFAFIGISIDNPIERVKNKHLFIVNVKLVNVNYLISTKKLSASTKSAAVTKNALPK